MRKRVEQGAGRDMSGASGGEAANGVAKETAKETAKEMANEMAKEMANEAGGAREVAATSALLLATGKGEKVTVLTVKDMTLIADYFVIASGASQRQVKALSDRVLDGLRSVRKPSHVEGYEAGYWVLLDYGDVVVHVFREPERSFYGLERLWGDAPRLDWQHEPGVADKEAAPFPPV